MKKKNLFISRIGFVDRDIVGSCVSGIIGYQEPCITGGL